MAKMTLVLSAKLARHEAALQRAAKAVYDAAAPRMDVRFNDCFAMASEAVKSAYTDADRDREAFHQEMINQGRAYRCASFGHFTPNWR